MKIIEALKELPIIEKRISKNNEQLLEYSGLHSGEESPFGSAQLQAQKVASLLQSNLDLAERYLKLKTALSTTNNQTIVEINGQKRTISEWIAYHSKVYSLLKSTYNALDITKAIQRFNTQKLDITEGVKVSRMYQEKDKLDKLEWLRSTNDAIDATLEIVNATTDLVIEV